MNKALSIIAVVLVTIITVMALRTQVSSPLRSKTLIADKLQVSASFYPIAEFVKGVGGEHVQVTTVVPSNRQPHNFEPTAQEIINLYRSQLFVYNGGDIDTWASRLENGLKSKNIPAIHLLTTIGLPQTNDPHIWLDPLLAQKEVLAIRDALLTVDPDHDIQYRLNAYNFNRKLAQLDKNYKSGLAYCKEKQLNTMHRGFSYLAQRYGIVLTNTKGAIDLNPIETITTTERQNKKDYISLMQDNLKILRTELKCR